MTHLYNNNTVKVLKTPKQHTHQNSLRWRQRDMKQMENSVQELTKTASTLLHNYMPAHTIALRKK